MDDKCKGIENKLYKYYEYKMKSDRVENSISNIEKQIETLNDRIRNAHKYIELNPYQSGYDISEKVQTSINNSSYFEIQLEKEITKIEKEKIYKIKEKHKLENKIMNMKKMIDEFDYILSIIEPEYKKLIELIYRYKKTSTSIAIEMGIGTSTIYRWKNKMLLELSEYIA